MNLKFLGNDLLAGTVVFFVAVPLCLGIAVASGAPPIAGLISGIIGGLVIGVLSKSQVSVSGPAAGLIVIVLNGIASTGSLAAFGLAVFIAGIFQAIMGLLRAGVIGYYFPSNVIKGMLAAIGIIIILKQFPHFVGYDEDFEGDIAFIQMDGQNTFSELFLALNNIHPGVLICGVVSILTIILWDKFKRGKAKIIPGALLGVAAGLAVNELYKAMNWSSLIIRPDVKSATGEVVTKGHLVQIPVLEDLTEAGKLVTLADFSAIGNSAVWVVAFTIALVASLETLLTIEATDKIDPEKRVTPTNRELIAQGVGNSLSGLIGGLPITSVIIRSSANISSGNKTQFSSIFHGFLLLIGTVLLASYLNLIPLTALAAILLVTGWKLANPKLFKAMFKENYYQWIPFIVTIVAILFTDLLIGIAIGMAVSIIGILIKNIQKSHYYHEEVEGDQEVIKITLPQEVSFLNKASLLLTLDRIKDNSKVLIDATDSFYIDHDVLEIIREFASEKVEKKNIDLSLIGFKENYGIPDHYHLDLSST